MRRTNLRTRRHPTTKEEETAVLAHVLKADFSRAALLRESPEAAQRGQAITYRVEPG